ncbi:MAG TPA: VanZ family protein [Cytophagaceae bacterium]|jgi:glycopeptide antibiotics resistance protein|nr:VanZ family protein [Cytophagaceae bacterium]
MILRYNIFTTAWAILILVLTLTPGQSMPDMSIWDLLSFDRFAHLFVFCVLVLLMTIGFTKQYDFLFLRFNAAKLSFLFSFGFSLIIELLQGLIPGRFAEINDVIANSAGCLMGSLVFYLIYKF